RGTSRRIVGDARERRDDDWCHPALDLEPAFGWCEFRKRVGVVLGRSRGSCVVLRRVGWPLAAAPRPTVLRRADTPEPAHQRRIRRPDQHFAAAARVQSLHRDALARLLAQTSTLVARREHPCVAALPTAVAAAGYLLGDGLSKG